MKPAMKSAINKFILSVLFFTSTGAQAQEMLSVNAFVDLAKQVNPAVVSINISSNPQRGQNAYRDPLLEMLEQFYGVPMNPRGGGGAPIQRSLGTGFVIRDDGLIVTNSHVVSGADVVINVVFPDKTEKIYEAKIIGNDARTDVALIKITGNKKFPTIKLGSSKDLQVGEWVAAFGNPFGNSNSMSKGIISAKGRDISEINRFPLIQTDAPINPGNSGGPLVNLKGEVIGINSAIDARAQGIGFAIPIDEVKTVLPQLEKFGKIKQPYLGVALAELNEYAAEELGIKDPYGAVIAGVEAGGPAAKGGLRQYDIVREFNGKKIEDTAMLVNAVADTAVDSKVKIKVLRNNKEQTVELMVTERPEPKLRKKYYRR